MAHLPRFTPGVTPLEDRTAPAVVGAPDPAFGVNGRSVFNVGLADELLAVAHQTDGKVVVAGTTGDDVLVARLNTDGTFDSTFGQGGRRLIDFGAVDVATGVVILGDGRIVIGGYTVGSDGGDFVAARLTPSGADDTTFGPAGRRAFDLGGAVADKAYSVGVNSFGGVYLAGSSGTDMAVVRLDAFGNPDKAFGTNGVRTLDLGGTEEARSVLVYPDARVALVGYTTVGTPSDSANPTYDIVALRLGSDGTQVDFGFGNAVLNKIKVAQVNFGGSEKAYAAVLQPDGRVVIVGNDIGAGSDFAIARLDTSGQPDPSFDGDGLRAVGFGVTDEARGVAVQPDGRIVVVGFATSDRSTVADVAAIRLTATGADDPTFGGSRRVDLGGDDRANAVALDSSGRVVLVGKTGGDAAIVRLNGTVGVPQQLLVSGSPNGTGVRYDPVDGRYVSGLPFNVFPGFTGTIRVASADVSGDGVADVIAGAGAGGGPVVAVYDGKSGGLLANFFAFEPEFAGGVLVAAGDFTGDGRADVVVTADIGGGPRVRVFDGAQLRTNNPVGLADFYGIDDANFRGGARPAAADINGDGADDLIVLAGPGGGPRVAVFDGRTVAVGSPARLVGDFFAFEPALRDGAFAAAGDFDGDGADDLIFGAGPGGAPRVRVIGGRQLIAAGSFTDIDQVIGLQIADLMAGDSTTRAGVRVAARDVDGDSKADLVTGSGPGQPSEVRLYRGASVLAASANPDQAIDPFSTVLADGVFVG